MGLIIVFAIAVAVGVIVFRLTGGGVPASDPDDVMPWAGGESTGTRRTRGACSAAPRRSDQDPGVAGDRDPGGDGAPIVAFTFERRAGTRRVVGIGAVAIAFSLYGIGMLIARILSAGSGTCTDCPI